MSFIKRLITSFKYRFLGIPLEFLERHIHIFLPDNRKIFLRIYGDFHLNCIINKNNYGDDLNIYLLNALTKCCILNSISFRNNHEHFLVIGSVINMFCKSETIIWGSGVMYPCLPLKAKPKKVLAVRGKLTREYLIKNGVDCPEVYGDPALLLPYIYHPQKQKKYKYGIIAHWKDEKEFEFRDLYDILSLEGKVRLISLTKYKNWKSVINEIVECECTLSSSLHGLIISDAYKIPNVWIEFSHPVDGDRFKFYDYFSSVNRKEKLPLIINTKFLKEELDKKLYTYSEIKIDLAPLVSSAPFEIRQKYKDMICNKK